MRYRSRKTEAVYRERRELVERLLKERPACEACAPLAGYEGRKTYNLRESVDLHEIVRRSQGGSILDEGNILAVCRRCHRWITEMPWEAANVGLHLPGWATSEMYEEAATLRDGWANGRPGKASWLDEI